MSYCVFPFRGSLKAFRMHDNTLSLGGDVVGNGGSLFRLLLLVISTGAVVTIGIVAAAAHSPSFMLSLKTSGSEFVRVL